MILAATKKFLVDYVRFESPLSKTTASDESWNFATKCLEDCRSNHNAVTELAKNDCKNNF